MLYFSERDGSNYVIFDRVRMTQEQNLNIFNITKTSSLQLTDLSTTLPLRILPLNPLLILSIPLPLLLILPIRNIFDPPPPSLLPLYSPAHTIILNRLLIRRLSWQLLAPLDPCSRGVGVGGL